MINIGRVSTKIFKLLKGHGYAVKMYGEDGMDSIDPEEARRFYVDDPNLMITLDEENGEIIFNKNSNVALFVYESALQQVKNIANKYMLNFTLKEFGKKVEPKDFSYQAKNVKENNMSSVTESSLSKMFGSKKTSRQTLENVQLLVRHKKVVDEEVRGSRARNIQSIFLECDGERFRFPHKNLAGARAMARHMSVGGAINDVIGEHIVSSTGNYMRLKEFMRYIRTNKLLSEDSNDVVSVVKENMQSIAADLHKLAGTKTYGVVSARIAEQTVTELNEEETDGLRDMFTVKRFDEKYNDVLPLVSQLVQEQQSFLRRIEESSASQVVLSTESAGSIGSIIQYESKAAEFGSRIREMGGRIRENAELASYVSGLGDKIIAEQELNEFEQSVLSGVLHQAVLEKEAQESSECLISESIATYKTSFEKYDHIFHAK